VMLFHSLGHHVFVASDRRKPANRNPVRNRSRRGLPVQKYSRKLWRGLARGENKARATDTVLDDSVVPDAIMLRLRKGRVSHLVHTDADRGRLVDRQAVPGQPPPPIGARDRIAGGLDLRLRGEQLG
jgi:hypothetical protein